MTRSEHLEWCKNRAFEFIESGQLNDAYASMTSDLNKHPETQNHSAIALGMQLLMIGSLKTPEKMRNFIQGFN